MYACAPSQRALSAECVCFIFNFNNAKHFTRSKCLQNCMFPSESNVLPLTTLRLTLGDPACTHHSGLDRGCGWEDLCHSSRCVSSIAFLPIRRASTYYGTIFPAGDILPPTSIDIDWLHALCTQWRSRSTQASLLVNMIEQNGTERAKRH